MVKGKTELGYIFHKNNYAIYTFPSKNIVILLFLLYTKDI